MSEYEPEEVHDTLCEKCNSLDISARRFVTSRLAWNRWSVEAVNLGFAHEIRGSGCVLCSLVARKVMNSLTTGGQQDGAITCSVAWRDCHSYDRATSEQNQDRQIVVSVRREQPKLEPWTKCFSLMMLVEDAPGLYSQGRLIQREQAPFEMIKSWIARCLKDHGSECETFALEN